jgi:hypothetical protein
VPTATGTRAFHNPRRHRAFLTWEQVGRTSDTELLALLRDVGPVQLKLIRKTHKRIVGLWP